ncbi:dockerin type I domain-containing protein [Stieleria magnilauensis]
MNLEFWNGKGDFGKTTRDPISYRTLSVGNHVVDRRKFDCEHFFSESKSPPEFAGGEPSTPPVILGVLKISSPRFPTPMMPRKRRSSKRSRRPILESLEDRRLLNVDWRNPADNLDVNADLRITPIDALQVINEIARREGATDLAEPYSQGKPYIDVNGSDTVSPIDALQVINGIALMDAASSSGERIAIEAATSFSKEVSTLVTLGSELGTRILRIQLDAQFPAASSQDLTSDVIAIYLVDPDDSSVSLLGNSARRDPVFAITPRGARPVPGLSKWDGSTVEIDLTSARGGDTGRLIIQTINRDQTPATSAQFNMLSNTISDVDPYEAFSQPTPNQGVMTDAIDPNQYQTTGSVEIVERFAGYDPTAKILTTQFALNTSDTAVGRQVVVSFPDLPAGVELIESSGDTDGIPYISLKNAIGNGGLGVNSTSRYIEARFSNAAGSAFSLAPSVLTGPSNQPPTIQPVNVVSTTPGAVVRIPIDVSDTDEDRVSLSVTDFSAMPSGELTGRELVLRPTIDDIGTHTFSIMATDGVLSSSQQITVEVQPDTIGTTRVSGKVIDVDTTPIAGLQVELAGVSVRTNSDGEFTVEFGSGPLVSNSLRIRGDLFGDQATYPFIAEKVPFLLSREPISGVNNHIDRPIYLPKLNPGMTIDPLVSTEVTTPYIEDVSVMINPGTLVTQQGLPFAGELSITEVPPAFTPAALPENISPDLIVTIQPGDMVFTSPAPITLPNRAGWAPGTVMDLWSVSPVSGEFEIVGESVVSNDGSVVETVSGGIRFSSWSGVAPRPPRFPLPDDPDGDQKGPDNDRSSNSKCNGCAETQSVNSSVEMFTGALLERHDLVSYQSQGVNRNLTFVYDSLRADPKPIIHGGLIDTAPNTEIASRVEVHIGNFTYQVPGFEQNEEQSLTQNFSDLEGGEHFFVSGDEQADADFAFQADLTAFPTGAYEYSIHTGRTQRWSQAVCRTGIEIDSGERVCRTPLEFVDRVSFSTDTTNGDLIVVNSRQSPYGNGWGIAGLLQLVENADGTVLMIDGDGSEQLFQPPTSGSDLYGSPGGQFGELKKRPDETFVLTTPGKTEIRFDNSNRLEERIDRNGNSTTFAYNVDGSLSSITDPVGLTTNLNYVDGRLTSVDDPAGRRTLFSVANSGDLTSIEDPDGGIRTWTYDSASRMKSEIDQLGRMESVEYDKTGRVIGATRKDGTQIFVSPIDTQGISFGKDSTDPANPASVRDLGLPVAMIVDANGIATTFELDRAGQDESVADPEGIHGQLLRNDLNQIVQFNDGRGNSQWRSYAESGNVISVRDEITLESRKVEGVLANTGDKAIYEFDLDRNQTVFLDQVVGAEVGQRPSLRFVITRNEGVYHDYGSFSIEAGIVRLPRGSYRLTVEKLPSAGPTPFQAFIHLFEDAVEVQDGQTIVEGTTANVAKIYKIKGNPGDTVSMEGSIQGPFNNRFFGFSAFNEFGIALGNGFSDRRDDIEVPASGYVYVVVQPSSFATDTSLKSFSFQLSRQVVEPITDNTDGVVEIEVGELVNDVLQSREDEAIYKFVLAEPTLVFLRERTPFYLPNDRGIEWELSGHNGLIIKGHELQEEHGPLSFDRTQVNGVWLEKGEYQLRFYQPHTFNPPPNRFSFSLVNASMATTLDFEGQSSVQMADALTTGTNLTQIDLEKDREYLISVDASESSGAELVVDNVQIFDLAGGLVADFGYSPRKQWIAMPFKPDNDGSYLISVKATLFSPPIEGNDEYFVTVAAGEFSEDPPDPSVKIGPQVFTAASLEGALFEYDQVFSQLTRSVDELGRQTLFLVDPATGNQTEMRVVVGAVDETEDGDDLITRYTYTGSGLLETMTDALGRVMRYEYDARDRLSRVVAAEDTVDEAISRYEYDDAGNQTAVIDPRGNRTEYQYDAMNRVTVITEADPDGDGPLLSPVTTFDYDLAGNLLSTTDATGSSVTYVYDERDQVVSTTDDLDQQTRYSYDPVGNLREVIDPLGNTTLNSYDGRNRLERSVDPDGGVTLYEYDTDNNLVALTDPVGNRTQFVYDARNRMTEEIDPLGNSTFYVYDAVDNLIEETDRNDRITTFAYDELDRLVLNQANASVDFA